MRGVVRRFLGRRADSLSAFACLLAVAMQLVLAPLHQAHGGHEARLVSTHEASGSFRAPAPQPERSSAHEPATCPQCRLLSQAAAPILRATGLGALDVRASLVDDRAAAPFHGALSGHEGPPRAPPLPA